MTLQVGFVGTDGILLASDTEMVRATRDTSATSKIRDLPNHGVAYSF